MGKWENGKRSLKTIDENVWERILRKWNDFQKKKLWGENWKNVKCKNRWGRILGEMEN